MNTQTIEEFQPQHQQIPPHAERTQSLLMTGFFHAVTGQRLILPPEEAQADLQLGTDFFTDLQPVGTRETHLVQRIIDITWRLHRAAAMENNIIETETLRHAQPYNDTRTEAVAAQAAAVRNDCENTGALDTLTRYDARLNRVLRQTSDDLERLQSSREAKGKPGFVEEECEALLWYEAMIHAVKPRQYTEQAAHSTEHQTKLTATPTRTNQTGKIDLSLCTKPFRSTDTTPHRASKKARPLTKQAHSAPNQPAFHSSEQQCWPT